MAVNAPSLVSLVDARDVVGGSLTAMVAPPAAGSYDHCQVLTRQGAAAAWVTGPTYIGTRGVAGAVAIPALTPGLLTDVAVYALDGAGNAGPPSIVLRSIPTTGAGPVSRRLEVNILATLQAMTIANGFPWNVGQVSIYRGPEDVRDDTDVFILVKTANLDQADKGCRGAQGLTESRLHFTLLAGHQGRDGTTTWVPAAAHELAAACTQAMLADPTRGGVAVDTTPEGQEITPAPELKAADAVILATYSVLYRTDRQNPYAEV